MEQVNILIIGAGAVGLAIGYELSKHYEDVVIVEKENSFGRHTSSRNSEVVHSGIYYPQNSLKAELCVQGIKKLYEYSKENKIPYDNCGKLVVATSDKEIDYLGWLKGNGEKNGVSGLEIYDRETCLEKAPSIKAKRALWVPSTGIIDTHSLMKSMESNFEKNDGFAVYEMEVTQIEYKNGKYLVSFSDGEQFEANILINSAGLFSDKIAEMSGLDINKMNLKLHWCKGEYFKTNKKFEVKNLIYPVPDPQGIFLGIHLTLNLAGEIRFGPNAYYINDLNYKMDDTYKEEFLKAINNYIEIDSEHIHADDTGIRAKLQGPNDGFKDFYIQEESKNNLPDFINLIGIESPGLTCCLSIGEYVKGIVDKL